MFGGARRPGTERQNEAERSGWMRGPRDRKSSEISNHFSLFAVSRGLGVDPGQRSKIFQNLLGVSILVMRGVIYGLGCSLGFMGELT